MKKLSELAKVCTDQLDRIGIKYGNVEFTVNTRAKRRWGLCSVKGVNTYEISISSRLLEDDADDIAAMNTIMHELAHAADGCKSGHRGRWLEIAAEIMRAYPEYNIKRCSTPEEKGIEGETYEVRYLEYKYFYRCLGCGAEAKYKRASKFTRNPNAYVCIKCRGKFVTEAEYTALTPAQRKAMNAALMRSAPKKLTVAEKKKIYGIKG